MFPKGLYDQIQYQYIHTGYIIFQSLMLDYPTRRLNLNKILTT